eukprot:EG_transcript_9543
MDERGAGAAPGWASFGGDGPQVRSGGRQEVSPWTWDTAGYLAATFAAGLDYNLLAPNLTAAARFFGFSESERDTKLGGNLSLGYFLCAAPVALLAGNLADLFPRRPLLAAAIALGKVPCLLAYFVQSYDQLFVLRVLMGITGGAIPPLTTSLAGDIFPVESRTLGTAALSTSFGLGALSGQFSSGWLGPRYDWRLPFLLSALPGFMMAAVVLCLQEPERASQEAALKTSGPAGEGLPPVRYEEHLTLQKVGAVFSVPSNVLGLAQSVPGCMPWGVINAYFNDFFAQDRGLTVQEATQVMVTFGLATVAGNLLGGVLGQAIYNEWKPGMPLLMGATTTLGILPTLALINGSFGSGRLPLMHCIAFTSGVVVAITGANIRTVFLNVNRPEVRGTMFGIFCVIDNVGRGLGTFLAAGLISSMGRVAAFNVCIWMWLICGTFVGCIAFTLEHDERVQQEQLAQYAEEFSARASSVGGGPPQPKAA